MDQRHSDQAMWHQIEDLENASKIPAKQRAVKISGAVEKLVSEAYETGLSNASVEKLIDIITLPNELDQASLGALVKNMYPADKVTDSIVIKVVTSFGHGRKKPSFAIQALLLKWLIMVYEVLEHPGVLSQLYGVLFNLLDTMAIRAPLCHLLSLITRRKHVRTFRIQMLMELTRHAGNEPPLVGLVRVYKDFYPDVIVGDTTQGRASVFRHPNPEWRETLLELQHLRSLNAQENLGEKDQRFTIGGGSDARFRQGKSSIVPTVHTSRAQENSTTLEEIEDASDLIHKLEKIEMPNQLVAVIDDPLLQKLLQIRSSAYTIQRIDNWLLAFFEDQLQSAEFSDKNVLGMLSAVRSYTQYTKILPSACIQYLRAMLPTWDGSTGRDIILDLLTYMPISSFNEIYQSTFVALEEAVLADTTGKVALLQFYTGLLRQWTTNLLTTPEPTASDGVIVKELLQHTNKLALTLLQTAPNVSSYSNILDFYEQVAVVISHPKLAQLRCITLPPDQVIYFLQFTNSINTISRLCQVLALYKKAFAAAMAPQTKGISHSYHKDYVNRFNGFLMDICNCVWRNRAFSTEDVNALGCLLPPASATVLTRYTAGVNQRLPFGSLFNLSFSPVLCLFSISYLREEEDAQDESIAIRHAGPATQTSLKQLGNDGGLTISWADYRLGVLRYLERQGLNGIGELMYNTMKPLMKNDKA
ncbi:hypothetical protein BP6252_01521 [Coleophoma cylindrospora]|uniref:Mis6-domain-containing protein n=1 Tax=Coleophoma cylindrospora TaxID=1849047 RepID=A0A3D8ST37_9HELO|nr:hypothetical protein BP6252_01521 [Coleophoma cylindrospora]